MRKRFRFPVKAFCLGATMVFAGVVGAADLAAGRAKSDMMCANCHGADGTATLPGAANLAGQQSEYLREQLRAFRSGARQNPQMSVVAKNLSDADIENLSGWYASIKVTVQLPD